MQTAITTYVTDEMIDRARDGAEKVRLNGVRGATMVSVAEIVAMATVLSLLDRLPLDEEETPHDERA